MGQAVYKWRVYSQRGRDDPRLVGRRRRRCGRRRVPDAAEVDPAERHQAGAGFRFGVSRQQFPPGLEEAQGRHRNPEPAVSQAQATQIANEKAQLEARLLRSQTESKTLQTQAQQASDLVTDISCLTACPHARTTEQAIIRTPKESLFME